MDVDAICVVSGCVALRVEGALLCAVHASYARRAPGSVAIYCYACGKLIRIDGAWVVRAEGCFHARESCLKLPVEQYKIAPSSVDLRPSMPA